MCCTFLLAFGIGPRIALVFGWIFGDHDRRCLQHVDLAAPWPGLAPWTTLMYFLAWGPVYGVSGWGWVLVGLGVFLDLATYSGRFAKERYQPAT